MSFVMIFLFTLAISIDGFVLGLCNGMNNIMMKRFTIAIITIISGIVVCASMFFGNIFSSFMPQNLIKIIAVCLLIAIGVYRFISAHRHNCQVLLADIAPYQEEDISINKSGKAALMLGLVLAVDAISSGFAVAMAGLPIIITSIMTMVVGFLAIDIAQRIGNAFSHKISQDGMINTRMEQMFSYLPSVCILCLAIWKFFEL